MISPPDYQKNKMVHRKLKYFQFRIKSCIDIVPNFKKNSNWSALAQKFKGVLIHAIFKCTYTV